MKLESPTKRLVKAFKKHGLTQGFYVAGGEPGYGFKTFGFDTDADYEEFVLMMVADAQKNGTVDALEFFRDTFQRAIWGANNLCMCCGEKPDQVRH